MSTLTAAQRAARSLGVGGSDAEKIMSGDWLELYNAKLGITPEEDLSWNLPVQIGAASEPFHRRYTARRIAKDTGEECTIEPGGPTITHPIHDFMLCNLDGFGSSEKFGHFAWEGKHVNQWLEKTGIEAQVERYYPQIQHNSFVSGLRQVAFSVIFGTLGHAWIIVNADKDYQRELVRLERMFWEHVTRREPPADRPKKQQPKAELTYMKVNEVAMFASNAWATHAGSYTENAAAAVAFEDAKTELKALMPEDATRAYAHGVQVTRSKAGALTVAAYKAKKGDVAPPITEAAE